MEIRITESIWQPTAKSTIACPSFSGEASADVVVIGAGITGLSVALFLTKAGKKVIVLEKGQIGSGTSGKTSAHLTAMVDARYSSLIQSFGEAGARRVARSMMRAIDQIESVQAELSIDCGFKRVPGYFYTEDKRRISFLKDEFDSAKKSGLSVEWRETAPLPFANLAAFSVESQAQFQPVDYLNGLAKELLGNGKCQIFSQSMVTEIRDGDACVVHTDAGEIHADDVVLATHIPLGINLLQSELHSYRSYVIAAKVAGHVDEGLYWDTEDPYHYIRTYRVDDEQILVVGGKDHKVGLGKSSQSIEELESYVRQRFDILSIEARWSAQFHDAPDGLPFIGKTPFGRHVYLGTGYSGDGLTFGTLAAMTIADLIVDGKSEYADLYAPNRFKLASAPNFMKKNLEVAKYFIGDRIKVKPMQQIDDLKPGDACVVRDGRSYLAVYRNEASKLEVFSAVCPHMKCIVHWNAAEKSWDCPCHASRFDHDGQKVEGPALRGLDRAELIAKDSKSNPSH